jgi:phosphoenolpyruvate carboxykinase (GTP)
MDQNVLATLKNRLGSEHYDRLMKIESPALHRFIAEYIELCSPATVFVNDDSPVSFEYIRNASLTRGEEGRLATPGHTYHFDAYGDQGRDKKNTRILVPPGVNLGPAIDTKDRDEGYAEIHEIMKGIMKGRELFVSFFCLGPASSPFTIPCVQLTDSSYVVHNEYLLYRPGYAEFVRQAQGSSLDVFYRFVHSQGEVDERNVSRNLDKRRIYIDLYHNTVYCANAQYGGNSIGLKKLAMRLAIFQASKEDWLTEHMLVLGVRGPRDRVTYFTGAYPSMCGKTSTAMLEGECMVGDDIAYLRKSEGEVRAANAERGMFGIMLGVNSKDDPLLWKCLNRPGDIVFSNLLVTEDNNIYWVGKDGVEPEKGINHSGAWVQGKTDSNGKTIPASHPNGRFTISLSEIDSVDPGLDDPAGFEVGGMVYGGRDSDTCVPVEEAFDWEHGIVMKGAGLESETTAATLGAEGVREINPMANLDFLPVSIGNYIQMNLDFGKDLTKAPRIYSVNYFLLDKDRKWLNERNDKKAWYKWMELRVNGDVNAIDTPTGRIPYYEDLKIIFKEALDKDYTEPDYIKQFTVRIPENLAKIERLRKFYKNEVADTPAELFTVLDEQQKRLMDAKARFGDYIPPTILAQE